MPISIIEFTIIILKRHATAPCTTSYNSTAISMDVCILFNGLLAELPTILDSFFIDNKHIATYVYMGGG